ncbi:hypothetical protein HYC85_008660 [Camellia sinensis]|uniref:Flavodoxin-like domain-containing protein n=1 Tax=Camellia sinensis TaxID=4442 RepID=A0A7J7HUQ4_CAMSI|nr:hypothetical protein HYC85_008660 [Camellia sinensis]
MSSPSSSSSSAAAHLTLLALLSATTFYCFYKSRRLKKLSSSQTLHPLNLSPPPPPKPKLFFISHTGTSKTLAHRLFDLLTSNDLAFDLVDPNHYEPEDLHRETLVLIVASTWEHGKPPPSGGFLANWLAESAEDFRVGSLLLSKCRFAVFGVGSKAYGETFNAVAREFSKRMRALGAAELLAVGEGDVDGGELDEVFDGWSKKLIEVLKGGFLENGVRGWNESDSEMISSDDDDDDDDGEENGEESGIVDLEDIAGKAPSRKSKTVIQSNGKLNGEKEMVTPVIRASLEKQFPDKIRMLKPVTQLYVSVDAATKDSLKAIDRPLFGDFWERFVDSLKALREKQQRTVYRLTLVKGWNTEDIDAYSSLFAIGNPDFVEIKGVTYCGSSATSKLTMENVPWHSDVKAFSEALAQKSEGDYEVACEHAHSCCILLAKVDKFKVNGQWFTWIDYEKFHDLVASGKPFDSNDYMAASPSWAVYGAEEGGFDPGQSRYRKERHHKSSH